MLTIRPATADDIPTISKLAAEIWWPTYRDFLSAEQISFMLDKMYSKVAIRQQMENERIFFLIAERFAGPVGFAASSLTQPGDAVHKLHKLYILPSEQGKGTGKMMIAHISDIAYAEGGKILELNVNRANPAFSFYQKLGFEIYQTVDIPYYQFELNDYVMRKSL